MIVAHASITPNTAVFVHSTRSTTWTTVHVWKRLDETIDLKELEANVAHYLETDEMLEPQRYQGIVAHLHLTKEQALRDMAAMLIVNTN